MRLCPLVALPSLAAFIGACLPVYGSIDTSASDGAETGAPASDSTGAPTTTGASGTTATDPTGAATTTTPSECGDGELDDGEVCDGAEHGGKTCPDIDVAFADGTLSCAHDCGSFDTSGCTIDPGAALVALNELTATGIAGGPHTDMAAAIELVNVGMVAADLSGWKLSDYVFPPGSTLPPGSFLRLVALDAETMMGELPFEITGSGTETITLADSRGATRDLLMFDRADAAVSYCRLPDGTGTWQQCARTFGAANSAETGTCGDGAEEDGEECDAAVIDAGALAPGAAARTDG